jgi:ribose transport system permease protein
VTAGRTRPAWATSRIALPVVIVLVVVVFAAIRPVFLSEGNIYDVSRRAGVLAILAVGQAMLVITGGFDLSISASMALGGVVGASVAIGQGTQAGILAALAVSVAVGLLNGVLVTRLRLSPLIVTLAMLTALRSIALVVTSGLPVYGMPADFGWAGTARIGIVSAAAAISAAVVVVCIAVMRLSPFGLHAYAAGSNPVASRLSGLNPSRTLALMYVINGLLVGIAGTILSSTVNSGQPNLADGMELQVLAAVFLGGVSIQGGRGSPIQVLLAVALLTLLTNGLTLVGVQSYVQLVVSGLVLIIAVSVQKVLDRPALAPAASG